MEQIKLSNKSVYELVAGGVLDDGKDKLQIVLLPGEKTFAEIETEFENENNTQKIKVVDSAGETVNIKNGYTMLDSISKQNNYVVGSEEYEDENGETNYRDVTGTVYIITLSKPDLREQVRNLQDAVDVLVLSGLEV